MVILASGDKWEPTEAVPSTTRRGGLQGTCCDADGTTVSVWYNVPVLEPRGVRVISVASVPFETVDLLDPNDLVECEEAADEISSDGSRRCVLLGGCMEMLSWGSCSNLDRRAAAIAPT